MRNGESAAINIYLYTSPTLSGTFAEKATFSTSGSCLLQAAIYNTLGLSAADRLCMRKGESGKPHQRPLTSDAYACGV